MWTIFFVLLSLIIGGVVGYLYGAQIYTHISTALGRPYFRMIISRAADSGGAGIEAEYNSLFIYEIERVYRSKPGGEIISLDAPDNEKIMIYVYDIIGNIAEPYLPAEQPMVGEDIGADVPVMGFRGGEEVKQVIDLGKQPINSTVDFVD